jgi:hypothetical protein
MKGRTLRFRDNTSFEAPERRRRRTQSITLLSKHQSAAAGEPNRAGWKTIAIIALKFSAINARANGRDQAACMVNQFGLCSAQELRACNGNRRIIAHSLHEFNEPSRVDLGIVVQERNEIALGRTNGAIIAFGKTVILVELNNPHSRKMLLYKSHGIVSRGIVN